MPRALDNLIGRQFGELLVLYRVLAGDTRHVLWHVACRCGQQTTVRAGNLRAGLTRSCGHASHNPAGRRGMRYVPC